MPNRNAPGTTAKRKARQSDGHARAHQQTGKSYLTFWDWQRPKPGKAHSSQSQPGATERRRRTKRREPAKPKAQKPETPCTRPKAKPAEHKARNAPGTHSNAEGQRRAQSSSAHGQSQAKRSSAPGQEPEKDQRPQRDGQAPQQKPQRQSQAKRSSAPATNPTARRKTTQSEDEKKNQPHFFLS